MLIQNILEAARKRLALLDREDSICKAAALLSNPDTPLVVVCDGSGPAVGVISRSDIVKLLAQAGADAPGASAGAVMTTVVLSCHVDQPLKDVWTTLSARSYRCVPILDNAGRPLGVVHARDLAVAMLDEVTYEEALLRDYVLGVGYQ